MAHVDHHDALGASSRQYRRGALLGMTIAEAFILIAFALLLLLAAWKTEAEKEIERYRQIETLTPDQVRIVAQMDGAGRLEEAARLSESTAFDTLSALERAGVDFERLREIAGDQERWRLIDKDELRRILDGAQELPEDIQRDLADLVEIDDPRQIMRFLELSEIAEDEGRWRLVDKEDLHRLLDGAEALTGEAQGDLADLVEAADSARIARVLEIAEDQGRWRPVDRAALRRLLDGAEDLPETVQGDLADLVQREDPREVMRLLELAAASEEEDEARDRLAGIGAQLGAAREAEADLVADLKRTLGETVSRVGGHIDDSGAVILQDTILFDVGSAQLRPLMQHFLDEMCIPWMQVMMRSRLPVSGAQIEGHASSEWSVTASTQEAYLNNLDLSQRRSAAVLRECLSIVSDKAVETEVESWARSHLRAVGFSSARPVMDGAGNELPEQSRRVVFSLDLDRASVIDDLEGEVHQTLSRSR